ncbi:MAG: hypothetical protein LBC89_00790 [Bacteroidales bacterium]|jgi:hypothetical protein|nr:hypothetical protein [Bacteroidales bacterium]
MKKLLVLLAASFVLFSCCNSVKKDECKDKKCCEMTEEQKADLAAWNDWDNQTDAKKAELVDRFKKCIDEKAASCKKDGEQCCKDGNKKECCKKDGDKKECCKKELTEEQKVACTEFKAKWDNWDNLTVDEKKALLDQKFECCKAKCEAPKEGCKKEGEKKECCDKK